ncbi:zinc-binding dehydrogenase [Actinosynnema sp. NPDC023658]|uniref:zinc-binding dehydrogenase n=1 Tax=Actinosynnema sp. NPDC023658 TaxID=3155465 RepID=UPI0033EB472B
MEVVARAGRRELSFDGFGFPLPAEVDDAAALALAAHGVTAWHLLRTCAHLRRGESVVVHDAAGGVGGMAVQLAVSFGAGRVVATAATQAQRRLALRLGADAALDSTAPDLGERLPVAGLADVVVGLPVTHPVIGGVGGARGVGTRPVDPGLVDGALAVLAPFGRLVCHGEPVDVDPVRLGSRAVVGFRLTDCLARPEMVVAALSELTGLTAAGRLHPLPHLLPTPRPRSPHATPPTRTTR